MTWLIFVFVVGARLKLAARSSVIDNDQFWSLAR